MGGWWGMRLWRRLRWIDGLLLFIGEVLSIHHYYSVLHQLEHDLCLCNCHQDEQCQPEMGEALPDEALHVFLLHHVRCWGDSRWWMNSWRTRWLTARWSDPGYLAFVRFRSTMNHVSQSPPRRHSVSRPTTTISVGGWCIAKTSLGDARIRIIKHLNALACGCVPLLVFCFVCFWQTWVIPILN